jgi:hypothetical protein
MSKPTTHMIKYGPHVLVFELIHGHDPLTSRHLVGETLRRSVNSAKSPNDYAGMAKHINGSFDSIKWFTNGYVTNIADLDSPGPFLLVLDPHDTRDQIIWEQDGQHPFLDNQGSST